MELDASFELKYSKKALESKNASFYYFKDYKNYHLLYVNLQANCLLFIQLHYVNLQ